MLKLPADDIIFSFTSDIKERKINTNNDSIKLVVIFLLYFKFNSRPGSLFCPRD